MSVQIDNVRNLVSGPVDSGRPKSLVTEADSPQKTDDIPSSVEVDRAEVKEIQEASREAIEAAVAKISERVQLVQRDLQFNVHEETGKTVITVLDSKTEEVIRQIPSDEVLAIAEHIEELQGSLLKITV